MGTLSVLKFDVPDGAEKGLALLRDLQKQHLIEVLDAAVIFWPKGGKKPKTRHLVDLTGLGAVDGAFWGMLLGWIFFLPFVGMAVGALMGSLAGHFADYGIDDKFIKDVRSKVTEGTSALFLLTGTATLDKVVEAAKTLPKFEVISTNLSKEQEDKLRAAFAA